MLDEQQRQQRKEDEIGDQPEGRVSSEDEPCRGAEQNENDKLIQRIFQHRP
ncbi:hypothetical protein D3C86_2172810 [compost metagenome]